MAVVAVDAGHGGRDPGAVFEGRQEKEDVLRLALAVGDLLEQEGVDVIYTRTEDVYDTPYQKAVIANENNTDYLVSLHRNAVPVPGSAAGVETLVYADRGTPARLARAINANLADLGFENRGVIERPNLAVLRRSAMPAVLVEVGFIDNEKDNEKFDRDFNAIARAIADGILSVIHQEKGENGDPPMEEAQIQEEDSLEFERSRFSGKPSGRLPRKLYRVQVGAFRNRNLAYQLNSQLTQEGYPAFILMDGDLYKVQVGAFSRLENAVRMEYRLRAAGYDTYITT